MARRKNPVVDAGPIFSDALKELAFEAVGVLKTWFKDRKLARVAASPLDLPRSYLPALQKQAEDLAGNEPGYYIVVIEIKTREVKGFWKVPLSAEIKPEKGFIHIPIAFL